VTRAARHQRHQRSDRNSPAPIRKEGSRWYRSPIRYRFDEARVRQLTEIRRVEQRRMQEYMKTSACLMQFLASELDDPYAAVCGRCASCAGDVVPKEVDGAMVDRAAEFLNRTCVVIEPRKLWPAEGLAHYGFSGRIGSLQTEPGRALTVWGDGGRAELVQKGKYVDGRFSDTLVAACVELAGEWDPSPRPMWVTCVPSRNHPKLVPDLARRVAARLGLPFRSAIAKVADNQPQKTMENSVQQARNLDGAFAIVENQCPREAVLVIDDIADSRWTLTVVGALLRQAGCPAVFPLVLADASHV
jgi:ATP-dependent DNA helicase RecQ